jgi:lysophospholipase L1-like esterase
MHAVRHYHERVRAFMLEKVQPGGIVLLGSSHFEWFDTDHYLPGRRFVNRGIAGDRIGVGRTGILHRLDVSVFNCQPSFILFENGANDLGELWQNGLPTMQAIINTYERVVATIRERMPQTPMLIVNVFPTRSRYTGLNPLIRQFNPYVRQFADKYGCAHMDFHSELVDAAGELRRDQADDGLHLNDAGYRLWASRLDPLLPRDPRRTCLT